MNSVCTATSDDVVEMKQSTALPWIVCFSAALFFFFEFMQVNMFNAITPAFMKEFSLSAARVGQISAHYFYANLIFLFPAGMILDRFSTRKIIILAMASSVISTYVFSFVQNFELAEICRFITGIGGSFCLISCIRLATSWFPPRRLAMVIGLIITFAMFGGMLAQTPMTVLTDYLGWRKMLLLDATMGALMLLLILLFVQDKPIHNAHKQISHHVLSGKAFLRALGDSLVNLQNWLGGIYTSLMNLPIFLLGAMWGSLYLVQVHHLTRTESSLVTSMIFIGTILGSPAIGFFSDRITLRRLPMLVSALLSLCIILLTMFCPGLSFYSLLLLFLGLGFFTSAQIISYPLIAESNPRALTGTAEGIASTLIMAGGISQPIFGALMSWSWDSTLVNGLPLYSPHDFLLAMSMMPIAFVVAWLSAFFLKETHCKPLD